MLKFKLTKKVEPFEQLWFVNLEDHYKDRYKDRLLKHRCKVQIKTFIWASKVEMPAGHECRLRSSNGKLDLQVIIMWIITRSFYGFSLKVLLKDWERDLHRSIPPKTFHWKNSWVILRTPEQVLGCKEDWCSLPCFNFQTLKRSVPSAFRFLMNWPGRFVSFGELIVLIVLIALIQSIWLPCLPKRYLLGTYSMGSIDEQEACYKVHTDWSDQVWETNELKCSLKWIDALAWQLCNQRIDWITRLA